MAATGGIIVIRLALPLEVGGSIPHDGQVVLYMNGQPTMPLHLLVEVESTYEVDS